MSSETPTILALDFDGVICDGLEEYFQTAWQAYCQLWQVKNTTPPADVAESFYRLRPVVETGWEMPLVIHAILSGIPESRILVDWGTIAKSLLLSENLDSATFSAAVDGTRDRWIATDIHHWLAQHRFYPGIIQRLKATLQTSTQVAIISTKEGRFIQQLLAGAGVNLEDLQIYGKEVKRPKAQVLRELIQIFGTESTFWFVEDRFKTLQTIQTQPDLADVRLFLADWGYNTATERASADADPDISLISLEQFSGDFLGWCKPLTLKH
jgi:phosphoglycolate phosphatase-like HAD superfamily hydrolase